MSTLYLACPYYAGQRPAAPVILGAYAKHRPVDNVYFKEGSMSLLAHNFNKLWCDALNLRKKLDITHFLMLHSDIVPHELTWAEDMLMEMMRVKAPILSAFVPIKDERGLTSTAWDTEDRFSPKRMTMQEAEEYLGNGSYTHPDLLINTGLMLVDFTQEWVNKVGFTINDEIRLAKTQDGEDFYFAAVEPEDWNFSRQLKALGVQRYVTKAVKLTHIGSFPYPNYGAWGTQKHDEGDQA